MILRAVIAFLLCFVVFSSSAYTRNKAVKPHGRHLRGMPPVRPEVKACISALRRRVRNGQRFDRFLLLDRHVLSAKVARAAGAFSASQPLTVDRRVRMKGAARLRGSWDWVPARGACGLHRGTVVATSLEVEARASGASVSPAPVRD